PRETWYAAPRAPLPAPAKALDGHYARRRDAHDLFRFYAATTPHAVQRAEQRAVEDFDIGRRAGAFDPPFLVSGNPLAMRRESAMVVGGEPRLGAFGVSFRGLDNHPHVVKARSVDGDADLARDVVRATTLELPSGKPITSPVRSYEEHVARALLSEGFREIATAMLFVKELAVRIEEPAFAPAGSWASRSGWDARSTGRWRSSGTSWNRGRASCCSAGRASARPRSFARSRGSWRTIWASVSSSSIRPTRSRVTATSRIPASV